MFGSIAGVAPAPANPPAAFTAAMPAAPSRPAAAAIGARAKIENKNEGYFTKVDILDGAYDIGTIKPGDTVAFAGFGNFIDSLVLQVSRIRYTPHVASLTVGTLPVRLTPS